MIDPSASDVLVVSTTQRELLTAGGQGPAGAPGANGSGAVEVPFSYGDTPPTLANAAAGKIVYGVHIHIVVPFDGFGASLAVGDSLFTDRLMKVGENDPFTVGSYTTTPAFAYPDPTDVVLNIYGGSGGTQGSGLAVLYVQQ